MFPIHLSKVTSTAAQSYRYASLYKLHRVKPVTSRTGRGSVLAKITAEVSYYLAILVTRSPSNVLKSTWPLGVGSASLRMFEFTLGQILRFFGLGLLFECSHSEQTFDR